MKLAIHSGGFVRKIKAANSDVFVSTPRTVVSDGDDGLRIPKSAVQRLRSYLARIYPDLAKKPFTGTRLCWYVNQLLHPCYIYTRRNLRMLTPVVLQVHRFDQRRLGYWCPPGRREPVHGDFWVRTCIQGLFISVRLSDYKALHSRMLQQFLPNIGRLVADAIEGKLPPELMKKFAVNRLHEHDAKEPAVRLDPPADLILEELCTPEDLLP